MREMTLGMMLAVAVLIPGTSAAQQSKPPATPVVTIIGPSVIVFYEVPESDSVLVADEAFAAGLDN